MKRIKLFTAQLSKWRLIRSLGVHLLDITAKSGNPAFAPWFGDVMNFKRHVMSWEEYVERYRMKMRESQRENPEEWKKLCELPENVALACYCAPFQKCHRYLFKEILTDYYAQHDVEAVRGCEITGTLEDNQSLELEEHVSEV